MFVNGDAWGWQQDWSTAPEMIPVHRHDGMFWGIYYLQAGYGMKFNNEKSWSAGENFGVEMRILKVMVNIRLVVLI